MMTAMHGFLILGLAFMAFGFAKARGTAPERSHLKPMVYMEDFEAGELRGWSSYPPNQDTAYDPYIYPGRILPEDPGRCLVIKCEPLWNEDQTLGAVKLLDAFLDPTSSIRFRYYVKGTVAARELRIHLPLADGRRLVCVRPEPAMNRWAEIRVAWKDLADQGLVSNDDGLLRLTALAITLEVPKADPDVPIYLGLDDIEVSGLGEKKFEFVEPRTTALEEWPERIVLRHYREGESFRVAGRPRFFAGRGRAHARAPDAARNRWLRRRAWLPRTAASGRPAIFTSVHGRCPRVFIGGSSPPAQAAKS